MARSVPFPLGAAVTLAGLEGDPHPLLARLREDEPVSWVPALGGWLVTRYDLAVACLRDTRSFTVDDPRFTTARVVGPSMLSLDGDAHGRHRDPFARAFRLAEGSTGLTAFTESQAQRLVSVIRPRGTADVRREVAGPLAVAVVAEALGLGHVEPPVILAWYNAIVGAVTSLSGPPGAAPVTPGEVPAADGAAGDEPAAEGASAFGALAASLREVIRADGTSLLCDAARTGRLGETEIVSNAAVIMFGGIETTEGMIANAALYLLGSPGQLALVRDDPGLVPAAVEESLRLEPAAAFVDRYATADAEVGGAAIRRGDRVTVSLAAAGRDPAVFGDPDRFDVRRDSAARHLAFAHGPHFCLGAGLARLEAHAAIRALLGGLPGLRLDPRQPSAPRGLVFRKPPALHVRWDARDTDGKP